MLCKALDRFAPERTRTIVIIRPNAPGYNEEIAIQKRKRRRLKRKINGVRLVLKLTGRIIWNSAML